jgi:hypothetical protein
MSLSGFALPYPPRLNAMPLSDPASDNMAYFNSPRLNIDNTVTTNKSNMAYYNSPRLNIDNMVVENKRTFDSIIAA